MTQSFLGGRNSIVLRTGQIFGREDGAGQKLLSLGDIEVANMNMQLDIEPVTKPFKGRRVKVSDIIREVGGTITATLLNFNVRNFAMATLSSRAAYTQDAKTAEVLALTNLVPGEMTDLGVVKVTNVTVTDGDSVEPTTLVEGTHYLLDAANGAITWLQALPAASVTFSAQEVTQSDNVSVLSLLNRPQGIRLTISILGEDSEGNHWKFPGTVVEIRSESNIPLISDEVAKLEVVMSLVQGPDPNAPFGKSIEIPAQ